jgi:hypothetical protein
VDAIDPSSMDPSTLALLQYRTDRCPGRFLLKIIAQDSSGDAKSNWLYVDSFHLNLLIRVILYIIYLKCSVMFLESSTSTGYFSNSTGSSVTSGGFLRSLGRDCNSHPGHFEYFNSPGQNSLDSGLQCPGRTGI